VFDQHFATARSIICPASLGTSWTELAQLASPGMIQNSLASRIIWLKGAGMGDKGGKKDKEKSKQQQVTKHKQQEQKKQDKARPRTP
jgi:hypothetical protein